MNLQTNIPVRLWDAIRSSYESANYAHAILEATYLLSAVLRERAGVDGDGAALVGQALGGDQPKLRVNNLQTESEKNVQKGIEQILRGIYTGIRNPRSHDQTTDTKETADAIIHFIGYLLGILNSSKDTFTIESFIEKVRDPEFVSSNRYAELIVAEIPTLRLTDALIALFEGRRELDFKKCKTLVDTLLKSLTPTQRALYLSVVSNELRTASQDRDIRTALQMLTPDIWQGLDELPRLRIENKLIAGIRSGEADPFGMSTSPLSTWASTFLKSFTLRAQAARAALSSLEDNNPRARNYILRFFFIRLDEFITDEGHIRRAVAGIANAVEAGDELARRTLVAEVVLLNEYWQDQFSEALRNETDPENPAVLLHNGTPFLSSPENDDSDDIPF